MPPKRLDQLMKEFGIGHIKEPGSQITILFGLLERIRELEAKTEVHRQILRVPHDAHLKLMTPFKEPSSGQ